MSLKKRLKDWHALTLVAPSPEDPEVHGGRQGEKYLHTLLTSHLQFKNATLFPNKRVPAGRRRREIDLLVVTAKRIHVIEVKNWSGLLRIEGDSWIQTTRDGTERVHPDLLADQQEKNDVLMRYLERQGVQLDDALHARYFCNKVLFVNPRLHVQDAAIWQHPDVLMPSRLDFFLGQQPKKAFGERVLGSVIQWCLDSENAGVVMDGYFGSLPSEKLTAIKDAFDRLSTWDALHYFGERIEIGDLIHVAAGGQLIKRNRFEDKTAYPLQWPRNKTAGLLKALLGIGSHGCLQYGGGFSTPVGTDDYVYFHRAGDNAPVEIKLLELDSITLG
jgi:hypothetical protein